MLSFSLNPADLDLEYDQCTSADIQFFKRRGADIFVALYGSLFMDGNTEENILGMTTTLSLLCIEMNHPEVIVEMLRLIFSVQVGIKSAAFIQGFRQTSD